MADENSNDPNNKVADPRLSIPESDLDDRSTIYKLTLSMKKRFSPGMLTPSPEGAKEVRDLHKRLVEIDSESRELLRKLISLLDEDTKLEKYVKKRIEDPKVSKMWLLVEQLLECQDCVTNFDEYLKRYDDGDLLSNYENGEKSVKDQDEEAEETRDDRFKVRNILNGTESEAETSTTNAPDTNKK